MKLCAGIDGGGTSTKLLWRYIGESEIHEQIFGPFNINSIGEEGFRKLLGEISEYLEDKGQCISLCIGAAGISNNKTKEIAENAFKADKLRLTGDHEIALEAESCSVAAAIVAGTGSVCIARKADGTVVRAGGWGHLLGDEGSGYAIGRDALKYLALTWDGIEHAHEIEKTLAAENGIQDRAGLISFVYGTDKRSVASLAEKILKLAESGDMYAAEICTKNAGSLAEQAAAVIRSCESCTVPVFFFGGVADNNAWYRKQIMTELKKLCPEAEEREHKNSAAYGALLIAEKEAT